MGLKDKLNKVKEKAEQGANDGAKENKENKEKKHVQIGLEVKLPGMDDFKPLGKAQYNQVYSDDIGPRLLTIIDECAELLEPSGVKTEEGKQEDAMKNEITMLIKSITQLGRSSGMHLVIAPLSIDTIIPLTNGTFKTMLTIKPGDYIYDSNNNPTKVLSLSEVKQSNILYEIRLTNSNLDNKIIIIKADEKHRFPIFNEISNKIEILTTEEIYRATNSELSECSNKIKFVGMNNSYFDIISINIIKNELVRCIEIDSDDHLFAILGSDIVDKNGNSIMNEVLKENGCKGNSERSEETSKSSENSENIMINRTIQFKQDNLAVYSVLVHNTQRNDASIIPGVIQNNPLEVGTQVLVKSKINQNDLNNTKKG